MSFGTNYEKKSKIVQDFHYWCIYYIEMNHISGAIDEKLMRDIMQGNPKAMRKLYDLTVGSMNAVCSRYVPNDDDVKDVLQDSYIKIFSQLKTFKFNGENSLRTWMTRIVINESLQMLRSKKSKTFIISFGEIKEDELGHVPEPELTTLASSINIDDLMRLVRDLPDGCRTVFNLRVVEKLSHRTIATMLNISEGTSASQYHHARKLLANKIFDLINNKK